MTHANSNLHRLHTRGSSSGGRRAASASRRSASLLGRELLSARRSRAIRRRAAWRLPHFAPKAKRVIYLHQSGGPSQLEPVRLQAGAREVPRQADLPDSVRRASGSPA